MPAFEFPEMPDSRHFEANPALYELRYRALHTTDDAYVQGYALTNTPGSVSTQAGILWRQNVIVEPDGFARHIVTVPYAARNRVTGSYTFSFDTTGATVNIKAAREHIKSYKVGGEDTAYDLGGAIGVKQDKTVEGCDIILPASRFTVTFRHAMGQVDIPFTKNLARNTGKTNAVQFLTYAAGELLFLGAAGSDGTEADAEIAYHFAASENATGISFGAIANIVKQGHHYAWVEFEDTDSDNQAAVKPKRVHIERVYNSVDYAAIFGWGGPNA